MFNHQRAEHVAKVLVARSVQPGSLQERMIRQRVILEGVLMAVADVDRVDALVIVSLQYSAKFPH